jgi:hypothetical protein
MVNYTVGGLRPAKAHYAFDPIVWRDGYSYCNILDYPAQVTYNSLPFEILMLISRYSPATWWDLVRADPRVSRYASIHINIKAVKHSFTTLVVEHVKCTSGKSETRVVYRLPNSVIHSDGSPAIIYQCGLVKWYQNGKLHSDTGPAIHHRGYISKWYQNGVPYQDNGPVVIYSKPNIGQFDNEHYYV